MKCPKCHFANPEEMQFCVECGGKLEINCPKCGCGNSPTECEGTFMKSFLIRLFVRQFLTEALLMSAFHERPLNLNGEN